MKTRKKIKNRVILLFTAVILLSVAVIDVVEAIKGMIHYFIIAFGA